MSVPVLSAHKISTPAKSPDRRTNPLTTACLLASRRAPTGTLSPKTRSGMATGIAANGQNERELQGGRPGPAVNGNPVMTPPGNGEHDEIVANFQNRLLEMTDGVACSTSCAVLPK